MSKNIWDYFTKDYTLNYGPISKVYKVTSKKNGKKYALKEVVKSQLKDSKYFIQQYEEIKKLNSERIMKIKTMIYPDYYYILMEICPYSLEEYIQKFDSPVSMDDIKEIFIQLNEGLTQIKAKNLNHLNLKLKNILLTFPQFQKFSIKITDFCYKENLYSQTNFTPSLTTAPEFYEEGQFSPKSDLWSLGIILYYLMFKEYPYVANKEFLLVEQIKSGKVLKKSNDDEFNDLINKLLVSDWTYRINWEDYFAHPFFNSNNSFPNFRVKCEKHSNEIGAYCSTCKCNICKLCVDEHPLSKHNVILFSKIGFTKKELTSIEFLYKNIRKQMEKLNGVLKKIEKFYQELKKKSENNEIYETDVQNNFKQYFIKCLNVINEKLKIKGDFIENNILKGFSLINQMTKSDLKNLETIKAHNGWVRDVEVFPSGNIISVSNDLLIKIYDRNFKVLQQISNAHKKDVVFVNIKDENNFVTSSVDGSIYTWIKQKNKFVKNKEINNAHKKPIWKVLYLSSENIISCSDDKLIKIWILNNKNNKYECKFTLNHENNIGSILLLKEKNLLISSGLDGTKFWNMNDNYSLIKSIPDANSCSRNNLITLDDDRLFVGGGWDEYTFKIISLSQKKIIKEIDNKFTCFAICVIIEKGIFITGGESHHINVFRTDNYNCIQTFKEAHNDNIYGITQLKNGKIVSYSGDSKIKVWSI